MISKLHRGLIQLAISSIIFILILGLLESVFYFTISVRIKITEFFFLFFLVIVLFFILRYFLHSYSIFNNSSNHTLAHEFEYREPHIGDRLLNALQLEELMENFDDSKDLAEYAVSKVKDELDEIPRNSLYDPIPQSLKKTLGITVITAVILLMIFINSLPQAFVRLTQPTKIFPVPLPFVLNSISGNQEVQVEIP